MRRRWFPAAAGAAALTVGALTRAGRGRQIDDRLYAFVNRDRGATVDRFFAGVTEFGSIWASIGAAGALATTGRRREAADALGAAWAMWLLGQWLKKAFGRPRPYQALQAFRLLIDMPRGTSWPSSHPAVVLAFVTVASRDLDLSPAAKAAITLLPGAVALSRVYLGVHYPADIVGGLLLGRGVADLWTAALSPALLGRPPAVAVPLQ